MKDNTPVEIRQKLLAIENHIEGIMNILEINKSEDNERTPHRIAKMLLNEVFQNVNNHNIEELNNKMTLFNYPEDKTELILVKDIPFNSMCSHHWLPFFGKAYVGYIPSNKIIGLSKIPRVIDYFSKKPQVQEKLADEIMQYLNDILKPKAIFVYLKDVIHTCVLCRGAESEANTDTFIYINNDLTELDFMDFKREFTMFVAR